MVWRSNFLNNNKTMNCPSCKNPIIKPAPICEWCGANISIENPFKIDDKILELVKKKHLLAAVKLYADKTGCSLKEAKDYIDKIKI